MAFSQTLPLIAFAQDVDEEFEIEEQEEATPPPEEEAAPPPSPDFDADVETDEAAAKAGKAEAGEGLGDTRVSWQDIVVVVRKPFLKMQRLELLPQVGLTINDNMIRHFALQGQLNYFLTDVLSVGVEGQLYQKDFLETYDLVARQDRRLPTLNKYNWSAALNFGYVPIYGKFAVMNKNIIHWEIFATAGVGVTQSEVVPRNPALPSWTNMLITPNVGLAARVFLARWLTLNVGVRDYIFIDKYESVDRTAMDTLEQSKANADSSLVNHVMFQAGLSFWFPMSFEYTTFR